MSPRVLMIDPEAESRASVYAALRAVGCDVETASTGADGYDRVSREAYDAVVTAMRLPDIAGPELVSRLRRAAPDVELVLLAVRPGDRDVAEAIKEGAYEVVARPADRQALGRAVAHAIERRALLTENRRLRQALADREQTPLARLVGQSEAIRDVVRTVEQVADTSVPILLRGEAGTGKQLLAEVVHAVGSRRDRALVKVRCGSIPAPLVESTLFGDPVASGVRRPGRLAAAGQGTLFLGEVDRLPLAAQGQLLRVLREAGGAGTPRKPHVDCRLIAATAVDLATPVREGRFRADLYERLAGLTLARPPLRDRRGDIPLLAHRFVERAAITAGRAAEGFSRDAIEHLVRFDWPGNVRELEDTVERAVVLARGRAIDVHHLPEAVRAVRAPSGDGDLGAVIVPVPVGTPLDEVERLLIRETLRQTGGNKQRAASLLGIAARTIYRKLAAI